LVDDPSGGFLAAYNLGVVNERQGAYDKSVKRYFQALQLNADFSPALINLARLYLRQNRPADAERLIQKFVEQRPDNLGHRAAALEVALNKGAYEDVITKAKEILRKDERHVDAMYALAQANFQLGRFELARSVIDRAVELNKTRADLFNLYGSTELKLNNKAGAMVNYRKAVELRPQYPEARNNLGVLYHDARDFQSAAAQFEEAIRVYPDFKEAFLNLGNAYKGMKRYKDSENAFKRSVEIDDNFADGHFNLAILYLDSDVPGMDPIARLQKSIDVFGKYKAIAKQRAKDDPADKYIEEARKTIEIERQKAEMMRESQMSSEEPAPTE
jgi:tetratricopeptide (TPR) repeat protein